MFIQVDRHLDYASANEKRRQTIINLDAVEMFIPREITWHGVTNEWTEVVWRTKREGYAYIIRHSLDDIHSTLKMENQNVQL